MTSRIAARPTVSWLGGNAMTASGSYSSASPSASPAFARSTAPRARAGEELLDRTGGVRPTAVGEAVLPHARAAIAAVAAVREAVDDLAGLVRGRVAMGTVTSYSEPDVPALLGDFRARHPGVEITLTETNTDVLVAGLLEGTLDLGLVSLPAAPVEGLQTRVVTEDVLVAAVGHDHELAGRRSIAVLALRDVPLISLPHGTGLRSLLDDACAAAGFAPRIGSRPATSACSRGWRRAGWASRSSPRRRPRPARRSSTRSRSRAQSCAAGSLSRGARAAPRDPPAGRSSNTPSRAEAGLVYQR
jgi:DNA-binding transcriptional LysR family regulator